MVRFKMKKLLTIWFPILVCIILSACGSHSDESDKNSSQTVETTTTTETSSTSTGTATKVTSTTSSTTTTTTEAKINPDTYIGYWSPKDTEERELTIHNINEKEVMFSLWYLRTNSVDNVYAEFNDGAAYFNQSDFKGNLVFENNSIAVNIEESSIQYMEPSNYIYNKKREKSLQYGTDGGEIVCSDYHEIQGFYGSINSNGEKVKGLSTDYICHGKKYSEICPDVKNGRNIRTWSYANSYNEVWFECYDSDTDEYLGWIKDKYIIETPVNIPEPDLPPSFSQSELAQIAKNLGVPSDLNVTITQDEPYYWDGGGIYITYVTVTYNNQRIASAAVDSYSGTLQRDIYMYDNSYSGGLADDGLGEYEETPNVWCPYCGYGFFTTGVGSNGIDCPSCGENYMPEPGSPPDEP